MKKALKKIAFYFLLVWEWLKWVLKKKRRRIYEVTRTSNIDFMGMKHIALPKQGETSILYSNDKGHRTVNPVLIRKVNSDHYDIFTKYNRFLLKRIQ